MPEKEEEERGAGVGAGVGARIARELDAILLDVRKSFGMYGRTSWTVVDVGPDVLTVRLFHWPREVSVGYTARNVRNALLNVLRDTVPCGRFEAVFRRPGRSRAYRRVELAFWAGGGGGDGEELASQLVVIEENVRARRARWREIVDGAAGSRGYFRRGEAR